MGSEGHDVGVKVMRAVKSKCVRTDSRRGGPGENRDRSTACL
jgi:hypothetical protein